MANITVYPYGTGGSLPSSVGIINDLTTGGADKALSAQQGVVLNEKIAPVENALFCRIADLTNQIVSCNAAIRDADSMWVESNSYYGSVIGVSDWRGKNIKITANDNYGAKYCFLKGGVSINEVADFATGYTGNKAVPVSTSEMLTVPNDAEYIYVYMKSIDTTYTPSSLEKWAMQALNPSDIIDNLTSGGVDKVLSAEQGKRLNERLSSAENGSLVEIVDITSQISSCGATINNSNVWTAGSDYYGALITITDWREKYVKLTPNTTNGSTYCFTKSGVSDGNPVEFATGYTKTVFVNKDSESVLIQVPEDAVYLYVYMQSTSSRIYTPRKLSKYDYAANSIETNGGLTLFSYNIGHFSNGAHTTSDITSANYIQKVDTFRALLSNSNPDIYGVVEYSEIFGKNTDNEDVNTKDELFNLSTTEFESTQLHYACYALFANRIPVYNVKINDFDCLENETITHTTAVEAQDYRYISADIYAFGLSIKLIVAHLAFDNNRPNVLQAAQMSELYTKYASSPYVIMMGDFNYQASAMAADAEINGYTLANDGSMKTYPPNYALDNVLIKGLKFAWTKMVSSNLSDHNPLIVRIRAN